MQAFILYMQAVIQDGDYLNDWLTHLPTWAQPTVETIGHTVALVGQLIHHLV